MQNKAIKLLAVIGGGKGCEIRDTPYHCQLEISKLEDLYCLKLASIMFQFKTNQ